MSSFSLLEISGACASRHGGFVEAGVYDSACKLLSVVRTILFASFDCNPLRMSQDVAGAITSKPSCVVFGEVA